MMLRKSPAQLRFFLFFRVEKLAWALIVVQKPPEKFKLEHATCMSQLLQAFYRSPFSRVFMCRLKKGLILTLDRSCSSVEIRWGTCCLRGVRPFKQPTPRRFSTYLQRRTRILLKSSQNHSRHLSTSRSRLRVRLRLQQR